MKMIQPRSIGSHSTRVRGLKQLFDVLLDFDFMSHSTRVRGLKLIERAKKLAEKNVALYTSAWIETCLSNGERMRQKVALYTSAWIETCFRGENKKFV